MIKAPAVAIGKKTSRSTPIARLVMPQIRVSSLVAPLAAKPQDGPNQPYSHGHHGCRFRDCDQGKARRDRRAILSKRQGGVVGVAVNPGNDVYIPVKSTIRALDVSCCMEPLFAVKDPKLAFEMVKPPPLEIEAIIRVNPLNGVIADIIEKSPFPVLEVSESVPVNIVDVVRSALFWVTLNSAKGKDPVIALACKTVVQIVIVASRNRRRVEELGDTW